MRHGLGFVPIVWVRNLPGGDDIDGACTFRPAVETGIEIDYQLSQAGRGLKYSSDPTLLIREPAGVEGELTRGGANALVVSERGDAKLLEINGTAAAAVIDYVRTLREMALEGVHGNRASADRLSAAQSGRALELMNLGRSGWPTIRVSATAARYCPSRGWCCARRDAAITANGARVGELDAAARPCGACSIPHKKPCPSDFGQAPNYSNATRNEGPRDRGFAVRAAMRPRAGVENHTLIWSGASGPAPRAA